MSAAIADAQDRFVTTRSDAPTMNASVSALVYVGLLLAVLGPFAAGSVVLIALGVAALMAAGAFQAVSSKGS